MLLIVVYNTLWGDVWLDIAPVTQDASRDVCLNIAFVTQGDVTEDTLVPVEAGVCEGGAAAAADQVQQGWGRHWAAHQLLWRQATPHNMFLFLSHMDNTMLINSIKYMDCTNQCCWKA